MEANSMDTKQAIAWAKNLQNCCPKNLIFLYMKIIHDMDYKEIGASLGCSAESARRHYQECISELKQYMNVKEDN